MTNTHTDPLEQLIAEDFRAEDRTRLATLLAPYVAFDKNSKELRFKEPFQGLVNTDKLEIAFLAEKARALLFKDEANEGLGQGDIIALDIMPAGSVKSTLKRLFDPKQIRKSSNGKYTIPNYRLLELFNKYIAKEDKNEK